MLSIARALSYLLFLATPSPSFEKDDEQEAKLDQAPSDAAIQCLYNASIDVENLDRERLRSFELEGRELWLVDVDGDGAFGGKTDGWADARYRYLVPWRGTVWIESGEYAITIDLEAKQVRYRDAMPNVDPNVQEVLCRLNEWRMLQGMPPATLDEELTKGCQEHAAYCDANGMSHAQDPNKEGASPAGAEAAANACIVGFRGPSAVDAMARSFYHRLPILHPATERYGIGIGRRTTVIDGLRGRSRRSWPGPILVPAPGSAANSTTAASEQPVPHPERQSRRAFGCPITVTFPPTAFGAAPPVTDVEAQLFFGKPDGPTVKVVVSSPEDPANVTRPDNDLSICIFPQHALRPRSTYVARVAYTLKGERKQLEWEFRTGRR